MFVSIESDDFTRAIELGTQYMAYLCKEGTPCPVLFQGNEFQNFTETALKDSPYIKEAMVNAKQLDFMANATMARTRMIESSNNGLVFVNYLSFGRNDFRVHNRGPMPSVVFHIVNREDSAVHSSLRQFCGRYDIDYVQIDPGATPDIQMMFVYVHTSKGGTGPPMPPAIQPHRPVTIAATIISEEEEAEV